ncbi:hypothetical protein L1887_20947 [Cichorium endivia]|nr:hypothetical protein L1887_20947 [Cichorium endivia]
MGTKGRLIAGSHNRNEFVLINADDIGRVTSVKELSGQICKICGDEIEITVDEEPFVACNECAFPICRPCYEYERREGTQACPQCKTRYKRIKGSPRVEGDEEEDGFDNLDNEFDLGNYEGMLSSRLNIGPESANNYGFATPSEVDAATLNPDILLLTYGQVVITRLITLYCHLGQWILTPKRDIAVYGYGTVAWKDRMETWRKRQSDKLEMVKHNGNSGCDHDRDMDDSDLPK